MYRTPPQTIEKVGKLQAPCESETLKKGPSSLLTFIFYCAKDNKGISILQKRLQFLINHENDLFKQ